ncbi:transglycosylase family protein [Streptomyces sp. NPDC085596]|uniref:transglycosylase family protein n=1 Tax=Streptomyces sp. NPDC085596 TaxID=3365731 RepID=UPI0037D61A9E
MLSGNGRHRRPRQAPALLVAAGVTTSAIAIPLLGAASANAADGTTWDKVAECESGGSWSADTGNGYYGGLQISQDDWDKYGGTQYAASADQASRSQQISVAEKILDEQGTTHWATCALLAGLTSNSGSVDVDTGVSESPSADQDGSGGGTDKADETPDAGASSDDSDSSGLGNSSPSSDSSAKETGKPSASAEEKAGSGHSGKDTDTSRSGASAPAASGGGYKGGGSASSAPAAKESDDSWEAGGSWSLVDTGDLGGGGRHRGGSAEESVTGGQHAAGTGRHATASPTTYTVRDGDTLGSIADSLDVDGGWEALYSANKQAIGSDPNHVDPGQTLKVPGETDAE